MQGIVGDGQQPNTLVRTFLSDDLVQNNRTQQHKLWHSMYMTSLLHTQTRHTPCLHVYMFCLVG